MNDKDVLFDSRNVNGNKEQYLIIKCLLFKGGALAANKASFIALVVDCTNGSSLDYRLC